MTQRPSAETKCGPRRSPPPAVLALAPAAASSAAPLSLRLRRQARRGGGSRPARRPAGRPRAAVEPRQLALEQLLGLGLQLAEKGAQPLVVDVMQIDLVEAGSDGLGDQRLQAAPHVLRHRQADVPAGRALLDQGYPPDPRPRRGDPGSISGRKRRQGDAATLPLAEPKKAFLQNGRAVLVEAAASVSSVGSHRWSRLRPARRRRRVASAGARRALAGAPPGRRRQWRGGEEE